MFNVEDIDETNKPALFNNDVWHNLIEIVVDAQLIKNFIYLIYFKLKQSQSLSQTEN